MQRRFEIVHGKFHISIEEYMNETSARKLAHVRAHVQVKRQVATSSLAHGESVNMQPTLTIY